MHSVRLCSLLFFGSQGAAYSQPCPCFSSLHSLFLRVIRNVLAFTLPPPCSFNFLGFFQLWPPITFSRISGRPVPVLPITWAINYSSPLNSIPVRLGFFPSYERHLLILSIVKTVSIPSPLSTSFSPPIVVLSWFSLRCTPPNFFFMGTPDNVESVPFSFDFSQFEAHRHPPLVTPRRPARDFSPPPPPPRRRDIMLYAIFSGIVDSSFTHSFPPPRAIKNTTVTARYLVWRFLSSFSRQMHLRWLHFIAPPFFRNPNFRCNFLSIRDVLKYGALTWDDHPLCTFFPWIRFLFSSFQLNLPFQAFLYLMFALKKNTVPCLSLFFLLVCGSYPPN